MLVSRIGKYLRRPTRSPQIVRLDHVRNVKKKFLTAFHVPDCCMTLKNLVSGNMLPSLIPGICSRSADDLNRYGNGGCCVNVYATTLLLTISMAEVAIESYSPRMS